jgi:putative membrane protein
MSSALTEEKSFWLEAFSWRGAASGRVLPTAIAFGAFATVVYLVYLLGHANLAIEVGPHEVGGVLLSLLLVLRGNAGYDRWWEARKLWGGIVNQTRNLALAALAHGPADKSWREQVVRWTIAFAYAAKARLRGETQIPELSRVLGDDQTARVQAAEHPPAYAALQIDRLLRDACERDGMDRFAFLQAQRERSALIDHLGGCERIRSSPLPIVYSIAIRRFIVLFLATLPVALLHKFEQEWLAPLVTFLVAFPVLALDQIGLELQRPFSTRRLNHLPLDEICRTIENNLLALLHASEDGHPSVAGEAGAAEAAASEASASGSVGGRRGPA